MCRKSWLSTVLRGTKRSRLSVSFPLTYGFTNCGLINLTVWPSCCNSRAQYCALPHASLPMRHGGSCAIVSRNVACVTRCCQATLPCASTPCR
jgi:hypothetical protein